ncbi:MAG TPA: thiamine-phosphate kinase [Xanthomonadaceae bacterium]|nr:thiamine-phosphate kinase [Xanthomonadaceae bacterium]
MPEFALIERIRSRATSRNDVVAGIGDDAALLRVPPGRLLVVATDTLNANVHFPGDTAPADIGWKALAVNLSDLAAMAASPAWCTLALSLPDADTAWVDAFLDGFLELAALHEVALVGGDTTRGPLSVCVTVHGLVEEGAALRRTGARAGDDVWVSGTLGDAAGALAKGKDAPPALQARLDRPEPRIALGQAFAGIASAAIDVSDGLLADLAHVCAASGVGAQIELDMLPASEMLRDTFDAKTRRVLQATGGDDYEICFTAAPGQRPAVVEASRRINVPVTRIGRISKGADVQALDADDRPWQPPRTGYEHFGAVD